MLVQQKDTTYTTSTKKGSTYYGLVTSTISDEFPTNGREGDYWYVLKGLM